jgi:hypothetical protein
VEKSVEINFPSRGQWEENFNGKVILIGWSMCNYLIFIELQAYMLNHSAFRPFPEALVVK